MDSVSNLKLIDFGILKDDIMLINTAMNVLKIIIIPILLTKYSGSQKPLSLIMKCTPIRLLWSIPYVLLIYYIPLIITKYGVLNVPVYYYLILGFIFMINELFNSIFIISYTTFFIKISDPRFGGTYMTLLNTVRTLGTVMPNTVFLKMYDILTFKKCSNDSHDCSTIDFQNDICNTNTSYNCVTIVDGYYVEAAICMVIGFVWYSICRRLYKNLELKNLSHWIVNMNRCTSENI